MGEQRNIYQYTMRYGLILGIYLILKFPLLVLGLQVPLLELLFLLLTLAVPVITWRFTRDYRNKACGGVLSFPQAWFFGMLVYAFAALVVALAHFIYFRYIDGGYIVDTYRAALSQIARTPGMGVSMEQIHQMLDSFAALKPSDITFQLMMQNIFWGNLVALVTALIVYRKPKSE